MANESVTVSQSVNSVTVSSTQQNTSVVSTNPAAGLGSGGTIQGSLSITQNLDVDGILETDALTINGVTLTETIEDTIGAMMSGNTEEGIAVTYVDDDGKINFSVATQSDQNFTSALKDKLDGIEASADVTDTANVVAALTAGSNVTIAADGTISSSYVNTQLSDEEVQDIVGIMLTGNTETGISVSYDDTDGTIDFVVATQSDENFTAALKSKLEGIEASADVTDTDNVVAALTAGTNVTIAADGTISSSYVNTQLTDEQVQDIVGAMLTGNTEVGISVSYDDTDGTIDFGVASQTDNNFTNALKSKLDGISAGADVTPSWVPSTDPDYATETYVDTAVSNLVDSAPDTLDTLNELAAALGDDANFSTTVTNSIATKLPLAGGTMSGDINMGGNNITNAGEITATEFIGDLRGAVSFKAKAGEDISKGQPVYISGISGNTTVVSLADADDASKMPAFGIASEDASLNSSVTVINFGSISNLSTSAYSEGDELFIATTAGGLTTVAPTGEGSLLQKIAKVTRADNSAGSITVMGAGRSNAVPNLNEGNLFVGNASNQAVADDTLHVDIANTRLGVGTTPSYTLDVAGTMRATAGILTGDLSMGANDITNVGNVDGRDVSADGSKLDGIESGATGDQTAAEIRTLVDSATDSNVFTDADHTKLDGIETGADVTDTANVVAALTAGTNVTIAADGTISSSYVNTQLSNEQVQDIVGAMLTGNTEVGISVTYDDTDGTIDFGVASQTDNNFTNALKSKLDGIETGATGDQTAAEIRTLVESASDSNVFTDADHNKLNGIEAGADVTDATNVAAAGALMTGGGTLTGNLTLNSANPAINFNGTSDGGVDMQIYATPEGLDFREPEESNKIHFRILDDTGVDAPFGYKVNGTTVIGSDKLLQNVTANASIITAGTLADARIPSLATSKITSGTFADARIAQSNVTQHEAALSITESQISDFGSYALSSHSHSNATTSAAGFMSNTDKSKLDGIASGANNYSLPEATATSRGGIELFSNTDQAITANAVSATSGRTYGIQLNSAGQAVVNVPWSDTNTTYSVGDGGLTQKNFTTTLFNKLNGIESGATGDQTAAEIRTLVESATDSNVFTDADHTKLNGITAPNAPTNVSCTVVGETIDVTFDASTTSDIDAYLVYSSVDGSDYGLISVIPPDDFSATMSIIDTAFTVTGTQAYRVYAMKYGILSSPATDSVSYTVSSAEPTDMSVVNLNNAYYVQWNPPSSNERFVTAYNVYKHEASTTGGLSQSSASLVYSGLNTNFMYKISGSNNNNYHQFWVETTIA